MIEFILFLLLLVCIIFVFVLMQKYNSLKNEFNELAFSKKSQSVKYGKLTEQWIPFSGDFPFDSASFRFLGNPIDGIAFSEDKIVFCEFKSNTSSLSEKQKKIKQLVLEKKVDWLEMHLK